MSTSHITRTHGCHASAARPRSMRPWGSGGMLRPSGSERGTRRRSSSGFTIVELLITIGVVILLLSILLVALLLLGGGLLLTGFAFRGLKVGS